MSAALSALLITAEEQRAVREMTHRLYRLVESALTWLASDSQRLTLLLPHHHRFVPHLAKTRGWRDFQAISRYDAVVCPQGDIKIIELNTCCPAGFFHAELFSTVTASRLAPLLPESGLPEARPATIRPSAVADALLELERNAGIEPSLVALLIDENQIVHELDLMDRQFRTRGRDVKVLDARELEFRHGRLEHQGQPISLTYHKFRLSVPQSRNHCWRDGFQARYQAWLDAQAAQAMVGINNLYGMTLGEDKTLLSVFQLEEFRQTLSPEDLTFLDTTVAWTVPLAEGSVCWRGSNIPLPELLRTARQDLVIKPANEGRGFEVVIGRECTDDEWNRASTVDPDNPKVVQEFIPPASFAVPVPTNEGFAPADMMLTLAFGVVCGEYRGLLARISPSTITNVAVQGMVQGAFVMAEHY